MDAHTLLWALADDPRLPAGARRVMESPGASTLVSVVTVWEIEIKRSAGRLVAPADLASAMASGAYLPLMVTVGHAVAAGRLPVLHRDPFDRMLVAQAMVDGLTIVTRDPRIAAYGVPVLWD